MTELDDIYDTTWAFAACRCICAVFYNLTGEPIELAWALNDGPACRPLKYKRLHQ